MSTARTAVGPLPNAGDGATSPDASAFGESRACFEDIVGWLAGTEAASLAHGQLEGDLDRRGRDLLRRLLQDHLDLRAQREERVDVTAVDDVLGSDRYTDGVRADEATAAAFGATAVPFFVFDRRYGVAGAQPPEVFAGVLDKAWADGSAGDPAGGDPDEVAACDGGACPV